MSDHPLYECAKTASQLIDRGATIYQKYTCTNCGSRQTMAEGNKFFTRGRCEECSHITNIELSGCNYMVMWGELHLPKGDMQ
jgi:hypothetical protein